MSWDEFTWKVDVFVSKINFKAIAGGIAVIGGIALYATIPLAAPHIFGPRGVFVGWFVEWLLPLVITGVILGFMLAISWPFLHTDHSKWFYLVLLGVAGLFLLSAGGTVRDAGDAARPFKEREIIIAKTYYDEPQTGRGSVPESGGWHIITADGDEYKVRPSGGGDRLRPGAHKVELSHFKHIVMAAQPLQ